MCVCACMHVYVFMILATAGETRPALCVSMCILYMIQHKPGWKPADEVYIVQMAAALISVAKALLTPAPWGPAAHTSFMMVKLSSSEQH